jgi:hypothetical protein
MVRPPARQLMERKIDFLARAIEDARADIRALDARAGVLVLFEVGLLVALMAGLLNSGWFSVVKNLVRQEVTWFAALLLALFAILVMAFIFHVLLTLRIILPSDNPDRHVSAGEYQPRGLFRLRKLDADGRITPSLADYLQRLKEAGDEELLQEYGLELQRLAYVRRLKDERLSTSLLILGALILGLALYGFLAAVAGILY